MNGASHELTQRGDLAARVEHGVASRTRRRGFDGRLALIVVAWSVAVGYVAARWDKTSLAPPRSVTVQGERITSSDPHAYAGYFRRTLELPGRVRHAWVAISADNAFELTINGNPAGRLYLWRPTRPFQTGLSEHGQRVVAPQPALGLNFPREYQWTDHDNARLPVWLDVAPFLRPGRNVVCVEIEARHARPSFVLDGSIELWSGESVPLRSDATWRAEPTPPGLASFDWSHPRYDDSTWRGATKIDSSDDSRPTLSLFDPAIFQRPLAADWVTTPGATTDRRVTIFGEWNLDDAEPRDGNPGVEEQGERPERAFVRVLANRPFEATFNGRRLGPVGPSPFLSDGGAWVVNERRGWDDLRKPEIVDPDEIGSLFTGDAFLSPRHADPTHDPVKTYRNQTNVTPDRPAATSRSELPGTYDPHRDLEETRRAPERPDPYAAVVPLRALERDRGEFVWFAYDVSALVRAGRNTCEVRLLELDTVDAPNWAPRVAVDAGATLSGGRFTDWRTDGSWRCRVDGELGADRGAPVQVIGPAGTARERLPRLNFRGTQSSGERSWRVWLTVTVATGVVTATLLSVGGWLSRAMTRRGASRIVRNVVEIGLRSATAALVAATAVIGCVWLFELSVAERDESLWLFEPEFWGHVVRGAVATAGVVGAGTAVAAWLAGGRVAGRGRVEPDMSTTSPVEDPRASERLWNVAAALVVVFAALLRAYEADVQPIDDDECASVQAVIAIARTGAPAFVPDGVFYSRSPAYHYLTAAVVAVFGENLWALRLPSVAFGAATVGLTYFVGIRLLGSRAVAFGAALLMAVHPFEIFTSHVARFYQQQQFFALLTLYWFCLGFVTRQSQTYRYLTVLGFLVTVVSQEISIIMAPLFVAGAFLFGKDLGWRKNLGLATVAAVALGWIVIDWLAFQTLCLTRTEGVSPNFEATVKPHFWQPLNLLSLFIGCSRLHLALSAFIAIDLFLGWRARPRATLALFVMTVLGVLFTNLLVTHSGLRYQYFLFPTWALAGMDAVRRFAWWLAGAVSTVVRPCPSLNVRPFALGLAGLFLITTLAVCSPWRVPGSYDLKLLPDSTGACRYVAGQLRPEDRVMITEPHPHAALIETGRADFDLSVPTLLDFVVLRDGMLIDRNAGAEAIGGLSELQVALENNPRVWILVNKEKLRSRGKNLRWEYPGARVEEFLRQNAELKYRSPFWQVYLWDVSAGRMRRFAGSID